ncbi:nucleotide exchange factor GrpE [Streptomyces sp. NPDC003015]
MNDERREPGRRAQDQAAERRWAAEEATEATEATEVIEGTEATQAAGAQNAGAQNAAEVPDAVEDAGMEDPATPRGSPVLPELDVEELRDRWQRAVAETENLRKRYERQLEDVRRDERDRVTAAWLPVVDHLELALQHAAADPRAIVAGVEAVCQQALAVLGQLGYQRIAESGEPFDPARHEAAQVREVPGAAPGSVLQVMRAGYGSDRGLLRPAVVAVAAKTEQ